MLLPRPSVTQFLAVNHIVYYKADVKATLCARPNRWGLAFITVENLAKYVNYVCNVVISTSSGILF